MESTVEMVTVRMSRGEISTPWGFDVVPPAIITRVSLLYQIIKRDKSTPNIFTILR